MTREQARERLEEIDQDRLAWPTLTAEEWDDAPDAMLAAYVRRFGSFATADGYWSAQTAERRMLRRIGTR